MLKNTPKIKLRGLFKIFGADDKSVLPHVQNGMSKEELLEKHKHVLGLQSIDVDMQAGEITVVWAYLVRGNLPSFVTLTV